MTCVATYISFPTFASVEQNALGLFTDDTFVIGSADELPSWAELLQRIAEQSATVDACIADEANCEGRMRSVRRLLERGNDLDRARQVRLVNRYINQFSRYRTDKRHDVAVGHAVVRVGQEWSTLSEFLDRGGDCEDYATAKYQLLRRFGFTPEDLRVVVVYDTREREHHAIIAVNDVDGFGRLLDTDNLIHRRRPPQYQYVFGVNEDSVWDYGVEDTRLPWAVRRALKEQAQADELN